MSAGGAGLSLGDTAGAMWNLRTDTSGSLHFDRFNSGAWFGNALALDKSTGRVLLGSGQTNLGASDTLAVGTLDGSTNAALTVRKGGKSVRLLSSDTQQFIDAFDFAASAALELRIQQNAGLPRSGARYPHVRPRRSSCSDHRTS